MIIKDYNSAEDLAGMIENEGLDYFFTEYLNPDSILDHDLRMYVKDWVDGRKLAVQRLRVLGVEI